jgi:ferredoxin
MTLHEKVSASHGVTLQIDHELCSGFGDCVEAAPDAFTLNEDSLAVLADLEATPLDALVQAAESCPVSAILIFGEDGTQLAPEL